MVSIRRIYIYLVAAVSLLAATFAVIALAQNLVPLGPSTPTAVTALLIAVVVIALPFYLGHWLWAQRLASREPDERASVIRRIYLYAMLAILLGIFVTNSYDLILALLRLIFNLGLPSSSFFETRQPLETLLDAAVALIVILPLWLYHELVRRGDTRAVPDAEHAGTVRRVYIYTFAAVGLSMTAFGIQQILRFIFYRFDSSIGDPLTSQDLVANVARLAVDLPLWIIFWSWGQRLFFREDAERASALRKLYLYLAVFCGAFAAVSGATLILAGILRGALGLFPNGSLSDPLSVIIVAALVWGFHAFILRRETNVAEEAERQASLRRLYWYLVAAIGFGAFLLGLGGVLSVLIRVATGGFFDNGLKEALAYCTAALVAGLPIWLIPWRRAQTLAVKEDEIGAAERRSIIRKIYLYFFLLLATLTMLGCAIYILARLLTLALGDRSGGSSLVDLIYPLAYGLLAAGVWVYHIFAIRLDGARFRDEQAARRSVYSVAIVDSGEAKLGHALVAELNRLLPGLTILPFGFAIQGADTAKEIAAEPPKLIVGAWTMLSDANQATAALRAGPARKLLVPTQVEGADWIGIDATKVESLAQEAGRAVKQIVEGESSTPRRGLHPAVIVLLALVGMCIVFQILVFAFQFFRGF